ncbi:hypothetical protein PtA15_2A70 [Puccinia triticina]|uniref:Uncharacterized protein n=1 Tax=Puccinia triticina TaxID=208348 RepID=A0ABY7CAQ6_9BASI|nr:uncharacterized protein PtA15_2A70 [Puccinia triticina]WAQ81759.1 hypothetical protein PtA15_2A70 [Puccinia triticina]WAR52645.1 hypothetical protein PtB15_2B69 [Puccinia triticina]
MRRAAAKRARTAELARAASLAVQHADINEAPTEHGSANNLDDYWVWDCIKANCDFHPPTLPTPNALTLVKELEQNEGSQPNANAPPAASVRNSHVMDVGLGHISIDVGCRPGPDIPVRQTDI